MARQPGERPLNSLAPQLRDPVNHRAPLRTLSAQINSKLQTYEPFLYGLLEEYGGDCPLLNSRLVENNDREQLQHIHHDMPFASLDFVVAVVRAFSLHFRGLDALAVDNGGTRFG